MSIIKKLNNIDRKTPLVMGILNVTPDSFFDGGKFISKDTALFQVEKMINGGVDIIDVGGESTRPAAELVSIDEELQRVIPIIEWIKEIFDVAISIDTYKTEVMRETLSLGVAMINDVNSLQSEGALELVASSNALVCLMHKQGEFLSMQDNPVYDNVVKSVCQFLKQRVLVCQEAGINLKNIVIDPGFGFGKSIEHNVELFRSLDKIVQMGSPVLVGVSNKSIIVALQGDIQSDSCARSRQNRLSGSIAAAVVAMQKGVAIVRVHDVKETVQALRVASMLV